MCMTIEENLKYREDFIKKEFKKYLGYDLNLENPKTFNEKIQWIKLYYNDPLMTKCADKYLVREYIKEKIGEEYLIPLLGVWDKPEDIDFDSLPNQFVLKVNWGSGQNIIVKDKSKLNINETISKLKYWLEPFSNHYFYSYEWAYKNIKPKIICEKYIEQKDGNLADYKIYCFNGVPHYIGIYLFRNTLNSSSIFYDVNWKEQDFVFGYNKYKYSINKPDCLDKILYLSKYLSSCFVNVRIDFYVLEDTIYFGELTFYDGSGLDKFSDIKWDYKFGELLDLPKGKKIEYGYYDKNIEKEQLLNLDKISRNYKEFEEDSKYKEKYKKLKNNSFALLGFFNEDDYFTIIILGLKIVFKKHQTRPDQTRPDLICEEYIYSNNIIIINKIQPMLQDKYAA